MQTSATISVNKQALEAIIQELAEPIDTADREAEKSAQDTED